MEVIRPEERDDIALWRRRLLWILLGTLGVFAVLVLRLWQLQILQGDTFDRLSDKNRIRLRRIPFTRGVITDRHGSVLADNRPAFRLMGVPAEIPSPNQTILRLSQGVGLDGRGIIDLVAEAKRKAPFRAVIFKEDLPWDEVAWVETHRLDLPGIWVEVEPRRFYPHGALAAHLIGYVGEISKGLLRRWQGRGYRVGDRVGKSGLEWMLEPHLRGHDGGVQVEVDAQGRQLMVIQEVAYRPGANVVLTQKMSLQKAAEEVLGDRAGAVVAGDPNTGEIFAMVSHPTFDPNLFSEGISPEAWQALKEDPFDPLQNRAIMSQYPPGSTYKIITALAGLEEGVITPKTRLFCPGYYELGDRRFSCWKEAGHGWMRLREAIVQSCDVFFYQVGQKVGVDRLAKYAKGFGLGRSTGFDSDKEKAGLVPTSAWKRDRFGEPWHPGDTTSLAIGQGFNLVTPLQQFVMISAVANGGNLVVPQVVHHVESADGEALVKFEPKKAGKVPARDSALSLLKDALKGAVQDRRGTGLRARVQGVEVAGKTGTAQVVRLQKREKPEAVPYKYRDHAWFVCFAPVKDPQIAVVVLVEHGGKGGAEAAPVAQQLLKAFFKGRNLGDI